MMLCSCCSGWRWVSASAALRRRHAYLYVGAGGVGQEQVQRLRVAVENGSIPMVKCCTCTPKAYVGASCAGVGWYRSRFRFKASCSYSSGWCWVPHPATCIARAYVCVGCGGVWYRSRLYGCVGGGTRAGSGSGSISGLCWVSASAALIGAGSGGVWYRSRLRFRCRAAVEKGSKGVVCCIMRRSCS